MDKSSQFLVVNFTPHIIKHSHDELGRISKIFIKPNVIELSPSLCVFYRLVLQVNWRSYFQSPDCSNLANHNLLRKLYIGHT